MWYFFGDVITVLSHLQPLESAEFRLRVSDSVEPAAMYAKTLKATEVSPKPSSERAYDVLQCMVFSNLWSISTFCVYHKCSTFVNATWEIRRHRRGRFSGGMAWNNPSFRQPTLSMLRTLGGHARRSSVDRGLSLSLRLCIRFPGRSA